MNNKFEFLIMSLALLCLWGMTGYSDEPKLRRPPGMPDNGLIAFDDYQQSVNSEDLADALAIMHFNFQVQVPDGTGWLRIALHLIEGGKDRDLGNVTLSARKRDGTTGEVIKGAKQFRVLVMVSPIDLSTADPLDECSKLRVFAKESLTGSRGSTVIINPFHGQAKGLTIHSTTELVRDGKVPPGAWDGFATRFDLLTTDDRKRALRISFE